MYSGRRARAHREHRGAARGRAGQGGGGSDARAPHGDGCCGPTTMTPGELLHEMGAMGMPRYRVVSAGAQRAYAERFSGSTVPNAGRARAHASRRRPLRANHDDSGRAIAREGGPGHATGPHGVRWRTARVRRESQRLYGVTRGAGARARLTATAVAGQPRRIRGSYCAKGGPYARHRTAWCLQAHSACTLRDLAAHSVPSQERTPPAGRGRSGLSTQCSTDGTQKGNHRMPQ